VPLAVGVCERYLGFPSAVSVSLYAQYRQSISNLPGTTEAAEGDAVIFGPRRQKGVELGKDVGAVNDIIVAGEGDYAMARGFRAVG
jgi:hypothetical protein